ncbi:hypothetical protein YC2023_013749 [Brassica napus]
MEKMLPQSDLHLPHFINHAQIFTHIHLKPHHGLFTLPQPNLLEPQQLLIRRSVYNRRLREQKHRVAPSLSPAFLTFRWTWAAEFSQWGPTAP